jgi:hypothetical protein
MKPKQLLSLALGVLLLRPFASSAQEGVTLSTLISV